MKKMFIIKITISFTKCVTHFDSPKYNNLMFPWTVP